MLDESICYFNWLVLLCRFYSIFDGNPVINVDPDQTRHDVASDLGLHCLSMNLLRVSW